MKIESLHEVMQSPNFFPVGLNIWMDKHGLFHGKVYGGDKLLFYSHKKQFINELLEELDDKASVFLEERVRGTE